MRLMIFSHKNWVGVSRLPFALKQAGFKVGVVCPAGSYLSSTGYADYKLTYELVAGREEIYKTLQRAFRDWQPDFVIPGDDPALWFLHNASARAAEIIEAPYLNTIGLSLCNPELRRTLEQKTALGVIADTLGIDFPAQLISPSLEDTVAFAQRHGFPVVLKRDYTYAGVGVFICRDLQALRETYAAVSEKAKLEQDDFSVQRYVAGIPASVSFSALNGKLLAAFAFYAEATRSATGFTSIARIMENPTMIEAAGKLVGFFGFSGFGGIDLILDDTNRPWLLEINPRPTPTSHLGSLVGADLCAAFGAAMLGGEPSTVVGKRVERVAMFPYAWVQASHTIGGFAGHHDVPWHDPPLLAMLIRDFWATCKGDRSAC